MIVNLIWSPEVALRVLSTLVAREQISKTILRYVQSDSEVRQGPGPGLGLQLVQN